MTCCHQSEQCGQFGSRKKGYEIKQHQYLQARWLLFEKKILKECCRDLRFFKMNTLFPKRNQKL